MIKLKYDSADFDYSKTYGQAVIIPDEINFDSNFKDEVQPSGDVRCVAFSVCDIAEDQQKIEFDYISIEDLWKRVPKSPQGSDPREVLAEAVNNGLLPQGAKERLLRWKSYWRADLGGGDAFDNVRSTMTLIQCPVMVGTYWYANWHGVEILPVGKNPQNGHAYVIQGWKQVNGEPHFIIEAWSGRQYLMPRETFNQAMKPLGMQTWVLSTAEIDAKRIKTMYEKLKDLMINLIILLRTMIKDKGVEPIVPEPIEEVTPQPSKLGLWADAIEVFEKAPKSWNNPGAIRGKNGAFLRFKTYKEGKDHLTDYLVRAGTGKHKAYKPDMTLLQFFSVYAPASDNNNPKNYSTFVAKRIGVTVDTKIKELVV